MIVSVHVTYVSAGGTAGLNDVVTLLEKAVPKQVASMEGILEHVIVRTCNRFELYVACLDNDRVRHALREFFQKLVPSSDITYILEDKDSIKHLFRVVCGLDSLIVGEDQIQHQVRECYMQAKKDGHVDTILSRLFDKAMIVGKRVRTETALNKGAVSVGSAAVELAESKIGDLSGKAIIILGAGDMASVIAKNLIGKNLGTVIVSNRTYSRALELSNELGGTAVSMDRLVDAIRASDVILVATGAPQVPNVALENMDSLESIAQHNVELRTKEISSAEKIVTQEIAKLEKERKEEAANEIIRLIGLKLADIREHELDFALSRNGSATPEELMESLSKAIINKITADVYSNLRKASREGDLTYCENVAKVFGVRE